MGHWDFWFCSFGYFLEWVLGFSAKKLQFFLVLVFIVLCTGFWYFFLAFGFGLS